MEQRGELSIDRRGKITLTEVYELELKLESAIMRYFDRVKSIQYNSMSRGDKVALLTPEHDEQPFARALAEFLSKELS